MLNENSSQQFVARQLSQLQALEAILLLEKETLQQHDPRALDQVTQQKNQLLLAIKELDGQIGTSQQFLQDKKAGLFKQELNDIESALKRCQQQNQINGVIIQQSQLSVERMKTSLLESRTKTGLTYNNKGKKSGGLSSIAIKA
jgi:flagella synthesis protein FlgN